MQSQLVEAFLVTERLILPKVIVTFILGTRTFFVGSAIVIAQFPPITGDTMAFGSAIIEVSLLIFWQFFKVTGWLLFALLVMKIPRM